MQIAHQSIKTPENQHLSAKPRSQTRARSVASRGHVLNSGLRLWRLS